MAINYSVRYAANPRDFNMYDSTRIRNDFLIENLFIDNQISLSYSHYDRFIVGGAKPVNASIELESIPPLKADKFLDRRELGIVNVGGKGTVMVNDQEFNLGYKEALYVGKDAGNVTFLSSGEDHPMFYLNSAPAHTSYSTLKITQNDAEIVELGSLQTSNHRIIRKLIVNGIVKTCQLQMGMTQLKEGSVWNTMPPHIHDRRMEAYFYFELPDNQVVSHFLGEPENTRHIWMKNKQAVLSPPWSVHCGCGTSNYSFIWGMAGENLDYSDMDKTQPADLR